MEELINTNEKQTVGDVKISKEVEEAMNGSYEGDEFIIMKLSELKKDVESLLNKIANRNDPDDKDRNYINNSLLDISLCKQAFNEDELLNILWPGNYNEDWAMKVISICERKIKEKEEKIKEIKQKLSKFFEDDDKTQEVLAYIRTKAFPKRLILELFKHSKFRAAVLKRKIGFLVLDDYAIAIDPFLNPSHNKALIDGFLKGKYNDFDKILIETNATHFYSNGLFMYNDVIKEGINDKEGCEKLLFFIPDINENSGFLTKTNANNIFNRYRPILSLLFGKESNLSEKKLNIESTSHGLFLMSKILANITSTLDRKVACADFYIPTNIADNCLVKKVINDDLPTLEDLRTELSNVNFGNVEKSQVFYQQMNCIGKIIHPEEDCGKLRSIIIKEKRKKEENEKNKVRPTFSFIDQKVMENKSMKIEDLDTANDGSCLGFYGCCA